MPTKIASTAAIAEKWKKVAPERADDYRRGVEDPAVKWAVPAKAAEANYEEGVRASIAEKRFGKGIDKAGDNSLRLPTIEKGTRRWPEGIAVAGPAYQAGFDPFRQVIAAVDPPRSYPRGDVRNLDRVKAYTVPLHNKKIGK